MHMPNSTRQILHVRASCTPSPSFTSPVWVLSVSLSVMAFPPRANHQEEEHILSVQKANVKLRTSALSTVQELRQGQLLLKEDLLAKTKAVGKCPHPNVTHIPTTMRVIFGSRTRAYSHAHM